MKNPELLLDLARLIKRYSPEDWDSLLRALEKPELRRQLIYFVQQMTDLSIESRESRNKSMHPSKVGELSVHKARLLRDIRIELRARRLVEVRELAYSLGLPVTGKSRRTELIDQVMSVLAHKDIGEIKRYLPKALLDSDTPDDYSRWGEVIMGRTPPKK